MRGYHDVHCGGDVKFQPQDLAVVQVGPDLARQTSHESLQVGDQLGCRLLMDIEQKIVKDGQTYHNGHVPDTFNSHGSTHSGWNL